MLNIISLSETEIKTKFHSITYPVVFLQPKSITIASINNFVEKLKLYYTTIVQEYSNFVKV